MNPPSVAVAVDFCDIVFTFQYITFHISKGTTLEIPVVNVKINFNLLLIAVRFLLRPPS